MLSFNEARLRALPRREGDVWQAAVRRLPGWVKEGRSVVRPELALCVGEKSGVELVQPDKSAPLDRHRLLEVVVNKALNPQIGGFLPGRVEVGSQEDAAILAPVLGGLGVAIEVKPVLVTVDAMMLDLERHMQELDGPPVPGLLSVPGMSVERVRAFADGAAAFYKAKPWTWSADEAVLGVEPAGPNAGLRFCTAMGAAGECEGLSFLASPEQLNLMAAGPAKFWKTNKDRLWSVMFDQVTTIPFPDADLWQDHALPVAGKKAYPVAMGTLGLDDVKRPSPEALTYMEAVLRAVASGSREELDAGGWEREVTTYEGTRTVRLTRLHEAPREEPPEIVDSEAILEIARELGLDLHALVGGAAGGRGGSRNRRKELRSGEGAGAPALPAGSALQLKITLKGSKLPIWRRVLVRADVTFATLHQVIQAAFGWTDSHLHEFEVDGMRLAIPSPYGNDDFGDRGATDSRKVRLDAVVRAGGPGQKQKLTYTYDFGDGWEHAIVVEKVLGAEEAAAAMERANAGEKRAKGRKSGKPRAAACLAGARRRPPEDCGGVWGYEEMVEIIKDPGHEEYADRREWLGLGEGEAWDAEEFDLAAANAAVGKVR